MEEEDVENGATSHKIKLKFSDTLW